RPRPPMWRAGRFSLLVLFAYPSQTIEGEPLSPTSPVAARRPRAASSTAAPSTAMPICGQSMWRRFTASPDSAPTNTTSAALRARSASERSSSGDSMGVFQSRGAGPPPGALVRGRAVWLRGQAASERCEQFRVRGVAAEFPGGDAAGPRGDHPGGLPGHHGGIVGGGEPPARGVVLPRAHAAAAAHHTRERLEVPVRRGALIPVPDCSSHLSTAASNAFFSAPTSRITEGFPPHYRPAERSR